MALIVQKYGGSSVADAGQIKSVAQRIAATRERGNQVLVVVSAMGDTTDELIKLAYQVTERPSEREFDMLLSTGELVSSTLLAMAPREIGYEAVRCRCGFDELSHRKVIRRALEAIIAAEGEGARERMMQALHNVEPRYMPVFLPRDGGSDECG